MDDRRKIKPENIKRKINYEKHAQHQIRTIIYPCIAIVNIVNGFRHLCNIRYVTFVSIFFLAALNHKSCLFISLSQSKIYI